MPNVFLRELLLEKPKGTLYLSTTNLSEINMNERYLPNLKRINTNEILIENTYVELRLNIQ